MKESLAWEGVRDRALFSILYCAEER